MRNHRDPSFRLRPLARAMLNGGMVLTAAAAVNAQAQDRNIETIYIVDKAAETKLSSPKYTAPLVDTPQTLSIIPSEVFQAQGAQNLTDVLRNTPGISFNAGENGFASNTNNFSMRGFDASGNIFTDGVRDSGNYSRDIFNLEQVEVAKGPAADNGRGGAGGYVNLVTKTPRQEKFIAGSLGYGFDGEDSKDRRRGTLDVNQPLTEGTAVRLNVLLQDSGVAGRQLAEKDGWGVAPSLAFGLGTPTRITLAYQHLDQSGRPDWGIPAHIIEGTMRYDATAAQADRGNFYGLSGDFDDNKSDSVLGRIEHDFSPNLSISNQTRWTRTERDAVYTLPTGYTAATQLVTTQSQAYARETETLANLTNLTFGFQTGSLQHSLAAGLELSREQSDADRFGTVAAGNTSVLAPDPGRLATPNIAPVQTNGVDIDTVALYVYDTIRLNDQWQLTGGLRGEKYEVDIASKVIATGAALPADGYEVSDTTLSGKIGLVYKPADNGSIYAAFGISSLPPGSYLSNPDISRTGTIGGEDQSFPGLIGQNNQTAKTQQAYNYEVGTKWNLFDDRLATTVSLFRTERKNVAISGKTPGVPTSPTVLQGYGEHIVKGVELGVSGRITDNWSVFAGALVMDSKREHSAFLDAARREANPNDYGTVLTTSGDSLAFTPDFTANLWTTYTFPIGLTIGAGIQHVGDSYGGRPDDADRIIPNGAVGELPGYTVANLMASYQVIDNLFVRLNIDNVTNELYATSANWPIQRVFVGPSRSYLLSADFRF